MDEEVDAGNPQWQVTYNGTTYMFDPFADLTLGRLRQMKAWFGVELGRWRPFMAAFGQGDPDALACVIWIVRNKAGERNVPEPSRMADFAVGEFLDSFEVETPTVENPTPGDASILASTETPSPSEPSTSGSSLTSAELPQPQ